MSKLTCPIHGPNIGWGASIPPECTCDSSQPSKEELLGVDTGKVGGDKTAKVYGFVKDGRVTITRVEYSEPTPPEEWEKEFDVKLIGFLEARELRESGKTETSQEIMEIRLKDIKSFIHSLLKQREEEWRAKVAIQLNRLAQAESYPGDYQNYYREGLLDAIALLTKNQ
jgi:hypothetical protein